MIEHFENDKCTVFSIVPFEIREFKPGLYPGNFNIPACLNDTLPERRVIGPSEHLMDVGNSKRPMRIVTPSYQIAASIVNDFLEGQLWTTPEAHPGITWIQNEISVVDFMTKHKDVYARIKSQQKAWFVRLCQETDNEWGKYHHTRVASNQAKFAAKVLGLEPEWMSTEVIGFTFHKCPACGTSNDSQNAVCSACRCVLNEDKYKSLKFAS